MAGELPAIPIELFERRIRKVYAGTLSSVTCECLHRHYEELRRWNPHLSLIGPGTREEVVERHYGESLAALELLDKPVARAVLDIGSGAGFPGLVLAAARPEIDVTLIESRNRKWSFLQTAIRRCGLVNVRAIECRIEARPDVLDKVLPSEEFVLTSRAVSLEPTLLEAIWQRSPNSRCCFWETLEGFERGRWRKTREILLAGAKNRRIAEYQYQSE